jgi:SAM-dependent methyltransferase
MVDTELHALLANDERHWWYRGRRRLLCAELDRVEFPDGARALDAGCGSGRTLDELAHYASVSGVDLSEKAVAAARARGHDDVRVGALERLPFPARTFDLITCLDVLEHVPDAATGSRRRRPAGDAQRGPGRPLGPRAHAALAGPPARAAAGRGGRAAAPRRADPVRALDPRRLHGRFE